MSEDTTHVGTRRYRQRRSRRLPLVLLAIAVTGLIALAAIAAAYQFGGDVAEPDAAPSPWLQVVDAKGTCVLMIKTGQEVTDLVLEFAAHPDGTTTDWKKMEQTVANLKTIRDISAPEQRADIEAHIEPLSKLLDIHKTGVNANVNFEGLRAAGLRTATKCLQYAD
jgi:hypothetical protein